MNVIVDTSSWIHHLRHSDPEVVAAASSDTLLWHPFVDGELVLGKCSKQFLLYYRGLKQAPVASHSEVLAIVLSEAWAGRGVGWVDVHLLSAAKLCNARIISRDKKMQYINSTLRL